MSCELKDAQLRVASASATTTSDEMLCSDPKTDVANPYHGDNFTDVPSDSESLSDCSDFSSAFGKRLSERSDTSSASSSSLRRGAPASSVSALDISDASSSGSQNEIMAVETWTGANSMMELPLWLAIDSGDHVQVVQGTRLLSPRELESVESPARESRQGEQNEPAVGGADAVSSQETAAKKAVVPQRPPGVFVQPPPGLCLPHHAVIGVVKPVQMSPHVEEPLPVAAIPHHPSVGEALPAASTCSDNCIHKHTFVWQADARKLTSSDKVIVSPRFEFEGPSGSVVAFRVMLYPREAGNAGRVSFKKARSIGHIQIKSETDEQVRLGLDVVLGKDFAKIKFAHQFGEASSICKAPGTWNFFQAVDKASQTLQLAVTVTSP